jgi:hypothetical protein
MSFGIAKISGRSQETHNATAIIAPHKSYPFFVGAVSPQVRLRALERSNN